MNKITFLLFLLIGVMTTSCSSKSVEPEEENLADVLIPFSDNYRTLRKRTVFVNGVTDTTFNYESGIAKSITFDGTKWYGYSTDAIVYFANKSDGVHILHRPLEKQSVLYKYPATNGEKYDTFTFQGSRGDIDAFDENNITNFEIIVMDNNATVTLPSSGKIFTGVIHVRKPTVTESTKGVIAPADWYLKPGVGSVLFRSYTDNSLTTLQLEEELIEVVSQ